MLEFEKDDLLRGKTVEPGWYVMEVGLLNSSLSSKGDSTNYVYQNSKIIRNAENGSVDFQDVPVDIRFNSKAKGFFVGFINAITGSELKPGDRVDENALSGKKVIAHIINDTYEGRIVNKCDGMFKHYDGV